MGHLNHSQFSSENQSICIRYSVRVAMDTEFCTYIGQSVNNSVTYQGITVEFCNNQGFSSPCSGQIPELYFQDADIDYQDKKIYGYVEKECEW